MEKMGGERFAEAYNATTKAVTDFLVRLAELIALAAVFDAASDLSASALLDWFSVGLKILVGAHFATIYKPIFSLLERFAWDLGKNSKLLIIMAITVALAPVVVLSSIELSEAVSSLATVSGNIND